MEYCNKLLFCKYQKFQKLYKYESQIALRVNPFKIRFGEDSKPLCASNSSFLIQKQLGTER